MYQALQYCVWSFCSREPFHLYMSWYLRWTNRESHFWSKEWRACNSTYCCPQSNCMGPNCSCGALEWAQHGYSYVQKIALQKNHYTKNANYCRKKIEESKKNGQTYPCSWINRIDATKRNIPEKWSINLIESPPKFQWHFSPK